jgi:hypothetical protein
MFCPKKKAHLTDSNKHWLRERKIYQAKGLLKQTGIAIHISDKVDFKPNPVRRDTNTNKRNNISR